MELLDLYDDNGNKLNKTVERGKKYSEGKIMLSIVFIKNKDNQYLIQKTSKEKGGDYSTTGGHITTNETPLECIIREIQEELGLKVTKEDLRFTSLEKHPTAPCLFSVYEFNCNIDLNNLTLQKEEVEKVEWLTKEQILKLIENNQFKESHGYLFKKIYIRGNYEKTIICDK